MKIHYSYIYTDFPHELADAEGLLIYQREQAKMYAEANNVELVEGPPVLLKREEYRFAAYGYDTLKWPTIRLFVSLKDLT